MSSHKTLQKIKRNLKFNKKTLHTVIFRTLAVFLSVLSVSIMGLLAGVLIVEFGPSQKARDLFVVSVMETSAMKFLATSFLGTDKVSEILEANSLKASNDITDTDLVVINPDKNKGDSQKTEDASQNAPQKSVIPGSDGQETDPDGDGIDIVDVKGSTFNGKMMIVYDPTRIFVGVSGEFGPDKSGKTIDEIYNSYENVVAGINGGGWVDYNGAGKGGEPLGMVISQGKVLWGSPNDNTAWECCGITEDGKLIVGTFSVPQALEMGIVNAAKYGSGLIVNNIPAESLGSGGGLNPRTSIGQRSDGAMLLLTIDGRSTASLGAGYRDVQDIMLKFEAVNAYALDGGSSTSMIFNGKHMNTNASVVGLRPMCTAFLVKGK